MPETKSVIVWFRRDLRLADNPALIEAVDHFDQVIPVFVDDHNEAGSASRTWLASSLSALSTELAQRGSPLVLRQGDADTQLQELIDQTGANAVFWNRLYDPETIARDKRIKRSMAARDVEVRSFQATLLFEPWEIETGSGGPYKVFSPFWRNAESRFPPPEPHPAPTKIPGPTVKPTSLTVEAMALKPTIPWDQGFWSAWTPGEAGAQERLAKFCSGPIAAYKEGRDIPADDSVSGLSPHIHFGEVSPATLYHAAHDVRASSPGNVDWFVRELGWREFAHHVLFHFPHTPSKALNAKYADFPWRKNHEPLLKAWQRGMTGIPLVDAGMRELWQTGYMHNRVRMIVASFLVKNIRAPWQAGADWFMDTLMDADLANNTLGWQWAAGCGADAAPYFRIFNPVLQGQKFDKAGTYVRRYVPELIDVPDRYVHNPWTMPANIMQSINYESGRTYPAPIVDLKASRDEALAALKQLTQKD